MKTLYESILSSNKADMISEIKELLSVDPGSLDVKGSTIFNQHISKINHLWEKLELNIENCDWFIAPQYNAYMYGSNISNAYVKSMPRRKMFMVKRKISKNQKISKLETMFYKDGWDVFLLN